jgi:hypothetical protein
MAIPCDHCTDTAVWEHLVQSAHSILRSGGLRDTYTCNLHINEDDMDEDIIVIKTQPVNENKSVDWFGNKEEA